MPDETHSLKTDLCIRYIIENVDLAFRVAIFGLWCKSYLIISEFCHLRYGAGDNPRLVFTCNIILNPFDKGFNLCC